MCYSDGRRCSRYLQLTNAPQLTETGQGVARYSACASFLFCGTLCWTARQTIFGAVEFVVDQLHCHNEMATHRVCRRVPHINMSTVDPVTCYRVETGNTTERKG